MRLRSNRVDMDRVRFVTVPYDDTWLRDSGPITLVEGSAGSSFRLLDFRFTGWGGKFEASDDDRLVERLPTLRFLARPVAEIEAQAQRLLPALARLLPPGFTAEACSCRSQIGSGALPAETIPSAGLRLSAPDSGGLDRLTAALRDLPRPVIGHLRDGALVLDLRTLEDEPRFLASLAAMPADALA